MKTTLNFAFGLVTLWTVISITPSEQLDPTKIAYNFTAYTLNFKPQTNETAPGGSGNVSSTAVLSVSTSVTSASTALPSETNSLSSQLSSISPVALNAEEIQKLGHILEQDKTVPASPKAPEATERTTASTADTSTAVTNDTNNNSTDAMSTNGTSTPAVPKIVLPTEETKTYIDTFFKSSLAWLGSDQYTLSIVVPILAGFLFAIVIIVTLAMFSCVRRRCRRRRFRKKILPETIRKMGPSDRARLLAETSDEEF